jgi:acyl-coenzyme A synthetase/AMP-(fatty) acid ligase/thioesterase domain-containing protein/acyl carrier protein
MSPVTVWNTVAELFGGLTTMNWPDTISGGAHYDWLASSQRPLDLNGPTSRPCELFDSRWVNDPILDLVRRVAERQPGRIAIKDGMQELTYRGLLDRALRFATRIAATVGQGELIAILLPNDASYPVAMLACLAAGCPCVVLDRDYPQDRNRTIIEHSGAKAIVLSPLDTWPGAITTIPLDMTGGGPEELEQVRTVPGGPDGPAVIIYTSGSTGQPKGIALSQRALLHRAGQLINSLHLNPVDKTLPLGSPCAMAGLMQTFEALLAGATLIKVKVNMVGIGGVLDAIERESVTAIFATPALLRTLSRIEGARARLASLRYVHPSGDVLLSADLELLGNVIPADCLILSAYGLTEAPAICQWFVPRDGIEPGRVPVGYVVPGYDYAIVDDVGRPVSNCEPGELVVRSRYAALGEWRDGRVVPGSLRPDQADPTLRILHTGDLVRQHRDGSIIVIGRRDRQIQIRGMRVEPYEIECALRGSSLVVDAAVVSREIAGEHSLTAFIVLAKPGDKDAIGQVKQHLAQSLPIPMRPSRIIPLERLPLLPGYKIDTAALQALSMSPRSPSLPSGQDFSTVDSVHEALERAWCRVLSRDSLERGEAFVDGGGDSLKLLALVLDVERQLGITLPVAEFDHDMTARDMARVVGAAIERPVSPPSRRERTSAVLLKSGTGQLSVFIAPGLGSYASAMKAVGKNLASDRPVFALQPAGLNGVAASEIGTAVQYVAAIREVQPRGPYVLVGHCLGGLIMLEAARILRNHGEEIALIALLDAYPDPRFWPMRTWLDLLAGRARYHLATMRRLRVGEIASYAAVRAGSLIKHITARLGRTGQSLRERLDAGSATLDDVGRDLFIAEAWYRRLRYEGKVVFFRPEMSFRFPADPRSVWRKWISQVEVVPVPGNHDTMCSTYADTLAAALDRCIDGALAKK